MNERPEPIVVELRPYQERRRTRSFGTGILLGLALSAFVIPKIIDLINDVLGDPNGVGP